MRCRSWACLVPPSTSVGINLPSLFGTCRIMAFATCGLGKCSDACLGTFGDVRWASDQVLSFRGTMDHLLADVPSVGFLMGCATCGLWNPFTDAPKRKSPLPSPRTPADSLRTRVRPSRFANRTGAEKARRLCRPEQEYAMPPVPFDGRRILSIDATPSLRVVRHASQFFVSSWSSVSGFDKGRTWSQTVRPGSRHR